MYKITISKPGIRFEYKMVIYRTPCTFFVKNLNEFKATKDMIENIYKTTISISNIESLDIVEDNIILNDVNDNSVLVDTNIVEQEEVSNDKIVDTPIEEVSEESDDVVNDTTEETNNSDIITISEPVKSKKKR